MTRTVLTSLLALAVAAGPAAGFAANKRPPAKPAAKTRPGGTLPRPAPARPVPKAPLRPQVRSLEVLPREVSLTGPGARQLLVVLATYSDGRVRDVSGAARYTSTAPAVVAVSAEGLVTARGEGGGAVTVALGGATARTPVKATDAEGAYKVRFSRDVVPVLTQAGCNGLSCHGSPVGKSGFKLSMYGSDPGLDYKALLTQERTGVDKGKRADPQRPAESLFLKKATLAVPHQGGMRFKAESPEYRTLLAWLEGGAANDTADLAPTVTALDILPGERILRSLKETGRLIVTARYSDGTSEDVTHKAVFLSNDDGVAAVDAAGNIEAAGIGETALMARYLGRVGAAQVFVPQPDGAQAKDYAGFQPANYVDQHAVEKWRKLGFAPAAPSGDAEFLRRLRLDLTGLLPTPDEVRRFLADGTPDRRARKIDELLNSEEYADWWALYWGDNLRNNSRFLQPNGAKAFHEWIRAAVAANKPYDQFVRELLTAGGMTFTNGAANYYRVATTPPDRAEQTAQLFLGVRLQCANCHNHPFEKWTRTNYHQFAAFFARVRGQGRPNNEQEILVQPNGEYRNPENNTVLAPAVLGEAQPTATPDADRRTTLAAWLTSPENTFFARNIANRLWAQMLGRGIVEPVDDVRVTNPAANEALLDALARDLVAHQFDVKHLLRTIANSRTYQLSSEATRLNDRDRQNFSRSYHRRLKAEALLDGLCQATGVPEGFAGYPAGTRAAQLTDNRVASYFMDIFGRPRRQVVCACEREETANITQALHMINGTINQKIGSDKGRLALMMKEGRAEADVVEELYLCTVSRPPTPEERAAAERHITRSGPNHRPALEDLFWALLNSREFLFNH